MQTHYYSTKVANILYNAANYLLFLHFTLKKVYNTINKNTILKYTNNKLFNKQIYLHFYIYYIIII